MDIQLRFNPRPYQVPLVQHMVPGKGGERAVVVWPRRHGKDLTAWNITFMKAMQRVGNYFYLLPTYALGRKIIWYGRDKDGIAFKDYIPKPLVEKEHDTEMRIHLTNGSMIQVVGADTFDKSFIGTGAVGAVFSEYAIMDERAWLFFSPILRENNGWAMFVYTPRGKNHGYTLFENAKKLDTWYVTHHTIETAGVLKDSDLDDDRAMGIPEDLIQQEYYCSFSTSNAGAYFGREMEKAEQDGRIFSFPTDNKLITHTAWDFGVNDATSIWFVQVYRGEVRAVDYYQAEGEGLPHYARVLDRKPYVYGVHLAPHDVEVREFSTGVTRKEAASQLGIQFETVQRLRKDEQIHAGHLLLPRMYFHKDLCHDGINALTNYERQYDEKRRVYLNQPVHNWASHGADAFLTLAVGIEMLDDVYDLHGTRTQRPTHYKDFSVTR